MCNPLFPPPVSQRIASQLADEFEAQAARERALGLPVTVMIAHDAGGQAKMEMGVRLAREKKHSMEHISHKSKL